MNGMYPALIALLLAVGLLTGPLVFRPKANHRRATPRIQRVAASVSPIVRKYSTKPPFRRKLCVAAPKITQRLMQDCLEAKYNGLRQRLNYNPRQGGSRFYALKVFSFDNPRGMYAHRFDS